jgi:hypothetical protein
MVLKHYIIDEISCVIFFFFTKSVLNENIVYITYCQLAKSHSEGASNNEVTDDAQVNALEMRKGRKQNRSIAADGNCVAKPDIGKMTLES